MPFLGRERCDKLDSISFQQLPNAADHSVTAMTETFITRGHKGILVVGEISLVC